MAFPISPQSYGTDLVKVKVGKPGHSREYAVHKSLLCRASPYFSAALSGKFSEASDFLSLSNDHPLAFDVLCHYLYSGQVQQAAFYISDDTPEDVLWLRVMQLADATMVRHILRIAYDRLRELFKTGKRRVPSSPFIKELYDTDTPLFKMQDYIVAHAVYWNSYDTTGDSGNWVSIYCLQPDFAVAVASHRAQSMSRTFNGCKSHPTTHDSFNTDVVFPATTYEEQAETKKEAEAEDDE